RDRQLVGLAVDVQRDQHVRRTQRQQHLVAREGQVHRLGTVTVQNAGNLVGATDTASSTLAELGARLGGDLHLRHIHSSKSETDVVTRPRTACYEERVDNGPPCSRLRQTSTASLAEQLQQCTQAGRPYSKRSSKPRAGPNAEPLLLV